MVGTVCKGPGVGCMSPCTYVVWGGGRRAWSKGGSRGHLNIQKIYIPNKINAANNLSILSCHYIIYKIISENCS